MQTIAIPYTLSNDDAVAVVERRMAYGSVVRSAYCDAASWDPEGGRKREGAWKFRGETELRERMKARFAADRRIDAWLVHCACREGAEQRRARPDGKVVFGSKAEFVRRRKHLITNDEWKLRRLRPILSLGDKSFGGNRHFRLSPDARTCTFSVYGRPVTLHLPAMHGRWGEILPMLAKLADADEVNLTFRLSSDRLAVTFDPMDLRPLPAGVTLQQRKDADLKAAGRKAHGRKRGPGHVPPPFPWTKDNPRPVHPAWEGAFVHAPRRVMAIDLNPNWIGGAVTENLGNPLSTRDTRVLDHLLIRLDIPPDASDDLVREILAKASNRLLAMARRWCCGTVVMEDGLGKLRSSGRNRRLNRLINGWARTVLADILSRRASMSGITLLPLWGGYSTTVGNIAFALPDACASAAEMGRRGIAAALEHKQILPILDAEAVADRWKDQPPPTATAKALATAKGWTEVHRTAKAARLGVRRPHPGVPQGPPRVDGRGPVVPGHAVLRLGHRGRPGTVYLPLTQARRDTPSSVRAG